MTPPDRPSSSAIVETVNSSLLKWRGWGCFAALLAKRPEMDLYLAGGALRNLAMGEGSSPSKDFDFFMEERDLDAAMNEIGHQGRIEYTVFGSPRWYPAGPEEPYCDLNSIQRFNSGVGACHNIFDILRNFDFTANAMALELRRGGFFDPLDAASDIRHRIMRAVRLDYPAEPVMPGHDLIRTEVMWLRLVHYTAKLGLEIEPETLKWLREHRGALRKSARYEEVFQRLHPRFNEVVERHGLG